ncbi:hypothetical protein O3M35_010849 [Rhynocoris fuscipes]|uniref:Uncharacterized protein n=1 Tax=Rhynocoris fuscipes TaxID=488301 RepID=A0AAW1D399_9HEMI
MGPLKLCNDSEPSNYTDYNTTDNWLEFSSTAQTIINDNRTLLAENDAAAKARFNEIQIIKAVFLAVVTIIILISICKMIFQLFVRYAGKQDK